MLHRSEAWHDGASCAAKPSLHSSIVWAVLRPSQPLTSQPGNVFRAVNNVQMCKLCKSNDSAGSLPSKDRI